MKLSDIDLLDLKCGICNQLTIKPNTLNECLHTYCESCILDHVKESTKCPTCDMEYGPTIHVHVKFDSILESIILKIKDQQGAANQQGAALKRKSTFSSTTRAKRPANIQILTDKTSAVRMSRGNSSLPTPISGVDGVYLFGLEPVESQELECPALENPILKSKPSITIRNLQKHLHRHLWPDQDIALEDIHIFYHGKFLGPEWSIEYIARTLWKNSAEPMIFNYMLKKQDASDP